MDITGPGIDGVEVRVAPCVTGKDVERMIADNYLAPHGYLGLRVPFEVVHNGKVPTKPLAMASPSITASDGPAHP